jgi:hypothetical protein
MGQYFLAVILGDIPAANGKEKVNGYMRMFGSKLMEHSFIGNTSVNSFEYLLTDQYAGSRIVWTGDYADNEPSSYYNLFAVCSDCSDCSDCSKTETETETETKTETETDLEISITNKIDNSIYPILINHTKKLYVDKRKALHDIHPLPLLTCEGNGKGSGDYFGDDPNKLVGSWARNKISVAKEPPAGYTELLFAV